MPPAEKHILEIDSAELAFGGRSILSGVYLLAETGCVTAVLGRNGCGKSCLMKILSGALKAGFCSMRIDGKWHGRFTEKEVRYLPQHAFIPDGSGWSACSAISDCRGRNWNDGFRCSSPCAAAASGSCRAGNSAYWSVSSSCGAARSSSCSTNRSRKSHPWHVETLQTLIRQEKMAKGILLTDHMYRHVTGIADRLYVMTDGQAYPCANDEELVRRGYLRRM